MGKKTIFAGDVVTRNGDGARARVGGIGNERESRRGQGGSVRPTRMVGGGRRERERDTIVGRRGGGSGGGERSENVSAGNGCLRERRE